MWCKELLGGKDESWVDVSADKLLLWQGHMTSYCWCRLMYIVKSWSNVSQTVVKRQSALWDESSSPLLERRAEFTTDSRCQSETDQLMFWLIGGLLKLKLFKYIDDIDKQGSCNFRCTQCRKNAFRYLIM